MPVVNILLLTLMKRSSCLEKASLFKSMTLLFTLIFTENLQNLGILEISGSAITCRNTFRFISLSRVSVK